MTLNGKCISVSKAVTDVSFRSKSLKTALIATILTAKNAHCAAKRLAVFEGRAFPPGQQPPQLLDRKLTFGFSTLKYYLLIA